MGGTVVMAKAVERRLSRALLKVQINKGTSQRATSRAMSTVIMTGIKAVNPLNPQSAGERYQTYNIANITFDWYTDFVTFHGSAEGLVML